MQCIIIGHNGTVSNINRISNIKRNFLKSFLKTLILIHKFAHAYIIAVFDAPKQLTNIFKLYTPLCDVSGRHEENVISQRLTFFTLPVDPCTLTSPKLKTSCKPLRRRMVEEQIERTFLLFSVAE